MGSRKLRTYNSYYITVVESSADERACARQKYDPGSNANNGENECSTTSILRQQHIENFASIAENTERSSFLEISIRNFTKKNFFFLFKEKLRCNTPLALFSGMWMTIDVDEEERTETERGTRDEKRPRDCAFDVLSSTAASQQLTDSLSLKLYKNK